MTIKRSKSNLSPATISVIPIILVIAFAQETSLKASFSYFGAGSPFSPFFKYVILALLIFSGVGMFFGTILIRKSKNLKSAAITIVIIDTIIMAIVSGAFFWHLSTIAGPGMICGLAFIVGTIVAIILTKFRNRK